MSTFQARFPGTCKRCGRSFPAGTSINWRQGYGAEHSTASGCLKAVENPLPIGAPAPVINAAFPKLHQFLIAARDRGLKWPKARFLLAGTHKTILLRLTRDQLAVNVILDGDYLGSFGNDGAIRARLQNHTAVLATLDVVAEDPAAAAKAYGMLFCQCSFCGLTLTDAGSVEVGYGPICAAHWGLPHRPQGTPAMAPVPVPAIDAGVLRTVTFTEDAV